MSSYFNLLGAAYIFTNMFSEIEKNAKIKCEKLREEYANLQNLPRKLKKKEKKRILTEWQIFSYNPLTSSAYDWL